MIAIDITEDILVEAGKRASNMPILAGSITNGQSNTLGSVGEVLVQRVLNAEFSNTYHYDLVHDGRRIDVKTKRCDSIPQGHYDCSVAAHGSDQDCDDYVFVRVLHNMRRAWILGLIEKSEFYTKATRYTRGDVDPSNGFIFRADCYNLPINQLKKIEA
jgi:hypothetical protein